VTALKWVAMKGVGVIKLAQSPRLNKYKVTNQEAPF